MKSFTTVSVKFTSRGEGGIKRNEKERTERSKKIKIGTKIR